MNNQDRWGGIMGWGQGGVLHAGAGLEVVERKSWGSGGWCEEDWKARGFWGPII